MPKCRINLYDICHTLELGHYLAFDSQLTTRVTCVDMTSSTSHKPLPIGR